MFEREFGEASIEELAEEHYVAPSAELGACDCPEEHRLSVALSEQRGRARLFQPDHKGIDHAYCTTFGRRCGT